MPRIATGVAVTTLGGYYTGSTILSKAMADPYIASDNIHRLQRVRTIYTTRAFQASLFFFSLVELTHWYTRSVNLYGNFFTDGLFASLMCYPVIKDKLRKTWSEARPSYL